MDTSFVPPSRGVLIECVRAATTAPSLHNSQPWLFRVDPPAIEVVADAARRLPVIDPDGREHLISVGAAVFTLRIALARAGYSVRTELLPPPVCARVIAGFPRHADAVTEALAAAIPHRHTNRWPFAQVAVPADALARLRAAARQEGAFLNVADPAGRDAILGLARAADGWLRERPHYAEEIARWTGRNARHDGVPEWAAGPWDALEVMPVRDFVASPGARVPFEPHPTVLVLSTQEDTPLDWLRAGQALQRVLLTATLLGLAATPISQPVEVPSVRVQLTRRKAQMVIRVGYGRVAGRSPRRPLSEVLI
ncbi:nitroreductase [Actinoplanes lutulentus]|uniref:Nitroreductase family protein n=1 Tax=Actinoplanes lutulentus TaxID=1287878 RepID=A0A327YX47_9ACTN|nr:nitroreductase family protein [Actinoplanes lutulentus]MBB2947558.1 nitroreductase [Actinoplanes lutulentus]RAK25714.1 nitroreductase family protein [Actinoplanes lutulentus]